MPLFVIHWPKLGAWNTTWRCVHRCSNIFFLNEVKCMPFTVWATQNRNNLGRGKTFTTLRKEPWDEGFAQGRRIGGKKLLILLEKLGNSLKPQKVPWKCLRCLRGRVDCWKVQDQVCPEPHWKADEQKDLPQHYEERPSLLRALTDT